MSISAPDLTQRPPRSPRCRLGGYALLPRMLDKGRADIIGKNGEYHYNCPLDQHFTGFVGINADELKAELATGKGDADILEWINTRAELKRTPWEIAQWSAWRDTAAPTEVETRDFFNGIHKEVAAHRTDIATWNDLLDLDDHVSYGGRA